MPTKLGDLLAAARKAKGLSLRQLSNRVGKSAAFLSMLENDDPVPTVKEETLVVLASELGLEADQLMGLARKVPEDALPDSGIDVALYRRVKQLSTEEKQRMLEDMDSS